MSVVCQKILFLCVVYRTAYGEAEQGKYGACGLEQGEYGTFIVGSGDTVLTW